MIFFDDLSSVKVFCSSVLNLSQQAHVTSLFSLRLLMKTGVSSALSTIRSAVLDSWHKEISIFIECIR
jgi:hypothetical protein